MNRAIPITLERFPNALEVAIRALLNQAPRRNFEESIDLVMTLQRALPDNLRFNQVYSHSVNRVLVVAPSEEQGLDFPQMVIPNEAAITQDTRSFRRQLGRSTLIFIDRSLIRVFNQNLGKYLRGRRVLVYSSIEDLQNQITQEQCIRPYSLRSGASTISFSLGRQSEEVSTLVSRFQNFIDAFEDAFDQNFSCTIARVKTTMSSSVLLTVQ